MNCPSCTHTAQCVACRMEGRPAPRLRRYPGRMGEHVHVRPKRGDKVERWDDLEGPEPDPFEDDVPAAQRSPDQAGDLEGPRRAR